MSEGSFVFPVKQIGEAAPHQGSPFFKRLVPYSGQQWHRLWMWGTHVQLQQQQQQEKKQLLHDTVALGMRKVKSSQCSISTMASGKTATSTNGNSNSGSNGTSLDLGISGSKVTSGASFAARSSSSGNNNSLISSGISSQLRLGSYPVLISSRYTLPLTEGPFTSSSSNLCLRETAAPTHATVACEKHSEPSAACFQSQQENKQPREQQRRREQPEQHRAEQQQEQHHQEHLQGQHLEKFMQIARKQDQLRGHDRDYVSRPTQQRQQQVNRQRQQQHSKEHQRIKCKQESKEKQQQRQHAESQDSVQTNPPSGALPVHPPLAASEHESRHFSVAAAACLSGIGSSSSNSGSTVSDNKDRHTVDLPSEALDAAAAAMRGVSEQVRLARLRLQEERLKQHHHMQQLQQRMKPQPKQQLHRKAVEVLAVASPPPPRRHSRNCRLDEGSYYTFKSARVNGVTVELKNREEVAASIHRLHCEYGIPLCREFGFRYFMLAEQHPLHRKAGSVIRKPFNNTKDRHDALHQRAASKSGRSVRPATAAAPNNSNSGQKVSTKWSYSIRIRIRQLQRPQELLQLPTQLGIFFHELAHLRFMNHGVGFACLLARIFRYATERGLFEPGCESELPSPWLWERVVFYCGGFVSDAVLQQLLLADPKARAAAGTACDLEAAPTVAAQPRLQEKETADSMQPGFEEKSTSCAYPSAAPSSRSSVVGAAPGEAVTSCEKPSEKTRSSLMLHEAARIQTKSLRVQQQQRHKPRRPSCSGTFQFTNLHPTGSTYKTAGRSASSSMINSSVSAPRRSPGKLSTCAPQTELSLQQEKQQKQKPQATREQQQLQQQSLKRRSSSQSSNSSSGMKQHVSQFSQQRKREANVPRILPVPIKRGSPRAIARRTVPPSACAEVTSRAGAR